MVTFPVGLKASKTWNYSRFGSLVPDVAVRFVPNVGDCWLNYNNTPIGAPAAGLRGVIVGLAGDTNMGMTWRYGRLETGVRYTGLFSERITNHNFGFLIRREW